MNDHPNNPPTSMPTTIMQAVLVMTAMTGVLPALSSLRKLNSRPSEKRRKMTPMSAQVLTSALSATEGV